MITTMNSYKIKLKPLSKFVAGIAYWKLKFSTLCLYFAQSYLIKASAKRMVGGGRLPRRGIEEKRQRTRWGEKAGGERNTGRFLGECAGNNMPTHKVIERNSHCNGINSKFKTFACYDDDDARGEYNVYIFSFSCFGKLLEGA